MVGALVRAGQAGAKHPDIAFDTVFAQIAAGHIPHGAHQCRAQMRFVCAAREAVPNSLNPVISPPDGNFIAPARQLRRLCPPKLGRVAVASGQHQTKGKGNTHDFIEAQNG